MSQAKWIVSPKYDLTFFIGSVLVSFGFIAAFHLFRSLGFDVIVTAAVLRLIFFYGLDQPHIFQTAARVYADDEQFRKIRLMSTVGLLAIVAGLLFSVYADIFSEIRVLIDIYGSYHIVRQNVGFIKAYRRLNDDESSERFDVWLYSIMMFACIFKDYSDDRWNIFGFAPTGRHHSDFIFFDGFGTTVGFVALGCALIYVANTVWRVYRKQMVNVPKLLLMGATGSLHATLFFFIPVPHLTTAIETAYHDVQYHGWMVKFQQRRFGNPGVWKKWLVGAFAFSLVSAVVYVIPETAPHYLQAGFLGVILFHYIIDGEIWKFREDPRLREMFFSQPQSTVVDLIPATSADDVESASGRSAMA